MGISYSPLPSSATGWKSGAHWLHEIAIWADRYEQMHMKPAATNHETAIQTTEILLWAVPNFAKPFGRQAVSALMDSRLRTAMMVSHPPALVTSLITTIFQLRRFLLRHVFLPRPYFLRVQAMSPTPSPEGKYNLYKYDAEPWYVKPTLGNRWGVNAWFRWSQGLAIPGDEVERFCPLGFGVPGVGAGRRSEEEQRGMEELVRERVKVAVGENPMGVR